MKYNDGSALLIVLLLSGLTSMLVMYAWFVMSLQYDIVLQRELWYKNFYATEKILNVGLVLVRRQFGQLMQQARASKQPLSFDLSRIFKSYKNDPADIQEIVVVTQYNDGTQSDTFLVRARRLENNVCTCQLQCLLKKVLVSKQSGPKQSDKEILFVASHFTLGGGI